MKIHHYSVFAAAPGGGKQFAIVEGLTDPAEMQRIAASSGQPLTGFILNADSRTAEVRFFSPTKEKGSSDSGALIVGEHLRRMADDPNSFDRVTVQMGNDHLEVFKIYDDWWSSQEDSYYLGGTSNADNVLPALRLSRSEVLMPAARVGNSKVNLAVRVSSLDTLMSLSPDFSGIKTLQQEEKLNGIIAFFWEKQVIGKAPDIVINRDNVHFRWFSPAKGLQEDNAGSYTMASLSALISYMAGYSGLKSLIAFQGEAMGKPSRLFAIFHASSQGIKSVQVGGKVELLEVRDV